MDYVVPPAPVPALPVAGSADLFPVRRVYCVGRNYTAHEQEVDLTGREPPFFFAKPTDVIVPVPSDAAATITYPTHKTSLHYEAELVVAIGKRGLDIAEADARDHVYGYAVGLDTIRGSSEMEMRQQTWPWELGKGFDQPSPVGPVHPKELAEAVEDAPIWLRINNDTRQDSDTGKLIWNVVEIVAFLSQYFELHPGDLVFTGSPAGMGEVGPGDVVTAGIGGLGEIKVRIGAL